MSAKARDTSSEPLTSSATPPTDTCAGSRPTPPSRSQLRRGRRRRRPPRRPWCTREPVPAERRRRRATRGCRFRQAGGRSDRAHRAIGLHGRRQASEAARRRACAHRSRPRARGRPAARVRGPGARERRPRPSSAARWDGSRRHRRYDDHAPLGLEHPGGDDSPIHTHVPPMASSDSRRWPSWTITTVSTGRVVGDRVDRDRVAVPQRAPPAPRACFRDRPDSMSMRVSASARRGSRTCRGAHSAWAAPARRSWRRRRRPPAHRRISACDARSEVRSARALASTNISTISSNVAATSTPRSPSAAERCVRLHEPSRVRLHDAASRRRGAARQRDDVLPSECARAIWWRSAARRTDPRGTSRRRLCARRRASLRTHPRPM